METVPGCSGGTFLPVAHSHGCKCRAGAFPLCKGKAEPPNLCSGTIHAQLCLTQGTLEQDGAPALWYGNARHTYAKKNPKRVRVSAAQDLNVSSEAFGFPAFDSVQAAPPLLHSSFGGSHG